MPCSFAHFCRYSIALGSLLHVVKTVAMWDLRNLKSRLHSFEGHQDDVYQVQVRSEYQQLFPRTKPNVPFRSGARRKKIFLRPAVLTGGCTSGMCLALARSRVKKMPRTAPRSCFLFMEVTQAKYQTFLGTRMSTLWPPVLLRTMFFRSGKW